MKPSKSIPLLALLVAAAAAGGVAPAIAGNEMAISVPSADAVPLLLVRRGRGGDDGPDHDAGDDRGGRGRGADDATNHDAGDDHGRRGRGVDDGAGHDAGDDYGRRGGVDRAEDDHGDDGFGRLFRLRRRGGVDDGPNHG